MLNFHQTDEFSLKQWILITCILIKVMNVHQFCDPRNFTGGKCDFHLKIERCLKRHNLENFLSIFTLWKLWISERRLAIDNGFNFVTQEILQVEDLIFTWRSRSVLNNTIQIILYYFIWDQLLIKNSILRSNTIWSIFCCQV